MKIKKILIFIIMIFLLCGCNATYNIDIEDNIINENLVLLEENLSQINVVGESGFSFSQLININTMDDPYANKPYNVEKIDDSSGLGLKYNQTSSIDDIENISVLNQCYIDFMIKTDENNIIVDTGDNFKCYEYFEYLDNVKIVLKTNHKVRSSNGTKNLDGTYTWNFDKNSNHQIKFTISKEVEKKDYKGIILISLCLIGLIGYKIYLSKKEK